MKNSTFKNIILTILLALPLVGMAQDVTLTTQAQVDAFTATSIRGNLTIRETTPNSITSLSGLRGINRVRGGLTIFSNHALSSLSGLENINRVRGDLIIHENTALSSLKALESLNRVKGDLFITSNTALSSLSGLENITTLGGSLNIGTDSGSLNYDNPNLANLCGIRQLITNGEVTSGEYFVGNNAANPEYATLRDVENCTTTYIGDLTLDSQAEMDTFPTTYTSITGYLRIQETTANSITSLAGLRSLTSVGKFLQIDSNTALNSLSGLDGLNRVGGGLGIYSNAALSSLSGLENIIRLGGKLYIGTGSDSRNNYSNPRLINLCAVRQLITNGEVTSEEYNVVNNGYNPTHTQIQETDECSITTIATVYTGSITFTSQAAIDAFPTTYTSITGDLTIRGTTVDNITNLSGLRSLISVGGDLSVYRNTALSSLSGLDGINRVGKDLGISYNTTLINLCAIKYLVGVGNKKIEANEYIVTGNGYNPTHIQIQETNQCSVITTVTVYAGSITLRSQAEIDAFTTTTYTGITGNLIIEETINNNITSLAGLRNLRSVGGYLNISANPALSSLSGLDGITSVGGDLLIGSNTALSSLRALDNLTSVGGHLYISENPALSSLSGLDGINRVEGGLWIESNATLSSLRALENITTLGGHLIIGTNSRGANVGNPRLINLCGVQQLITNGQITSGEYFVSNNGYNPTYASMRDASSCSSTSTCSVGSTIPVGGICTVNGFTFSVTSTQGCLGGIICAETNLSFNNFSASRNSNGSWTINSL